MTRRPPSRSTRDASAPHGRSGGARRGRPSGSPPATAPDRRGRKTPDTPRAEHRDRPASETAATSCRLYLVTPESFAPPTFAETLAGALDGGDVASLLISLSSEDEGDWRAALEAILPIAQAHGVAVLLHDRTELAAATEADGVHVEGGPDAVKAARTRLPRDRIVGAGRLRTRHDAMVAGELGVDYVLFGRLDAVIAPEKLEELVERVAWWAEIFEVPCVAAADDLGAVEALARAGADFVALRRAVWSHAEGPAAAVRQANASLKIERTAA